MTRQAFNELLVSTTADGTAVGNSATEAIIVPDFVFPANYFIQGTTIRFTLGGRISNIVTATPTITFKVHIGTATLSATAVFSTGALVTRATVATNESWRAEGTIVCRSSGTGGTLMCMGEFDLPNLTGATTALVATVIMPSTAPATQPVDTTVANVLGIAAQWSAASASNTIQVHRYHLECLN
jgi:hypothetical protein